VDDIAQAPSVTRELALIKVAASPQNRSQIFDLVEVFRARIVDLTSESLMIEMTGVESKIEGLIEVLREDEGRILEICRSGKMTMRRGHHTSGVLALVAMGTLCSLELFRIDHFELRKPIGSRLLGQASLHLYSSDAELENFSIYGVPHLEALADELRECQLRERARRSLTTFVKA
jgi:hypothetical protein